MNALRITAAVLMVVSTFMAATAAHAPVISMRFTIVDNIIILLNVIDFDSLKPIGIDDFRIDKLS